MSIRKVVVLGPPGSGKDTQADFLSATLQIPKISIGDLLRDEVRRATVLGKEIEPYLKLGQIPPGNIGTRVFKEALERGELDKGYVLVDFPRSLDALERYFAMDTPTHIFVLELEKYIALERMRHRDREDDRDEDRLRARYDRFVEMETPVIRQLRDHNTVPAFFIDASGDIENIRLDIFDKIIDTK